MKIEVIIPNYNGFSLISKNLTHVLDSISDYEGASITIVDDFSKQEEREKLKNFINEINKGLSTPIKLLLNEKNYGFSTTVDNGGLASDADLLVLLNSDVKPDKDFLKPILKHFKNNPNLFGVGCMDKSVEGDGVVLRGRGLGKFEKGMVQHSRGEVNRNETFWISGGSSVVRRKVFALLEGFDQIYNPFYWEDIDLSYRARKSGYEILFEKESVVEHRHEEGAIKKHYDDTRIKTMAYRNQFIFHWKNITDPSMFISHFLWLPYHFLGAIKRGDKAFFKGFVLALKRIPAIILKRNKQKKLYKKKDSDLF